MSIQIVRKVFGRKLSELQQRNIVQLPVLVLTYGNSSDGRPMFAYVAVKHDQIENFKAAQKRTPFRPEDYGKVLESGYGFPSEEIRHKMANQLGCSYVEAEKWSDR
jgi:hypothetical protein